LQEAPAEETAEDDDNVTTCQQTILPAASFDGLWESLIFDSAVKQNVLDYAMTAMLFSDLKVNPHIISWNRVVLLHGRHGIRLSSRLLSKGILVLCKSGTDLDGAERRYPNAVLLEINAHSLFSKVRHVAGAPGSATEANGCCGRSGFRRVGNS